MSLALCKKKLDPYLNFTRSFLHFCLNIIVSVWTGRVLDSKGFEMHFSWDAFPVGHGTRLARDGITGWL